MWLMSNYNIVNPIFMSVGSTPLKTNKLSKYQALSGTYNSS